jgi:Coenzyme PQQ synthesis protein D (PqqD)
MIESGQCYRKNENFVYRRIEDETILVPIKDNVGDMSCIYSLNEVGAFIWQHLNGILTLSEIKNMILNEFEVSGERVEFDLNEFIADLNAIDAIQRI